MKGEWVYQCFDILMAHYGPTGKKKAVAVDACPGWFGSGGCKNDAVVTLRVRQALAIETLNCGAFCCRDAQSAAPQAGPGRAKIGFAAFMAAKKRFCRNHHSVTASQHRSITALNLEPRTCSTPPCPTNSRHPSNSTQARFSLGIYPACSPCPKSPRFAAPPALSVLPIPGTTSPGSTLADTDTGAHWPHHRDLARRDSLVCAGHGGRHITTRVLTLAVATSP